MARPERKAVVIKLEPEFGRMRPVEISIEAEVHQDFQCCAQFGVWMGRIQIKSPDGKKWVFEVDGDGNVTLSPDGEYLDPARELHSWTGQKGEPEITRLTI